MLRLQFGFNKFGVPGSKFGARISCPFGRISYGVPTFEAETVLTAQDKNSRFRRMILVSYFKNPEVSLGVGARERGAQNRGRLDMQTLVAQLVKD